MTVSVDKQWFLNRQAEKGLSLRKMADLMGIDASALSRTFNGERKMKISEVGKIATILDVSKAEVLAHIEGKNAVTSTAAGVNAELTPDDKPAVAKISDHPGFGFMKGLIKIEEGFDITGPFSDEPWDEGYLGVDR